MDPGLETTRWFLSGKKIICHHSGLLFFCRPGGALFLGQDQDSVGGGFNGRQSWSGEITQFNIWDFALEDYSIENGAECRSDILGSIMKWQKENWILNDVCEDLLGKSIDYDHFFL